MATHSSILAWRIPWTEEPGGLQSRGRKELDVTEETKHQLPTVDLTVFLLSATRNPGDEAFRIHQSQPDSVPADWAGHVLRSTTVHLVADPSVPAHRDQ